MHGINLVDLAELSSIALALFTILDCFVIAPQADKFDGEHGFLLGVLTMVVAIILTIALDVLLLWRA